MRVTSLLFGRVVVFVNIDEVLPQRSVHLPEALPQVIKRYAFTFAPTVADSIDKFRENGFKFEMGKHTSSDGEEHIIQDLTIFNDGIVVTATTTTEAEAFLDDFLRWGQDTLGFRVALDELRLRAYRSSIVIEFDQSFVQMLRLLEPVCTAYRTMLTNTYGRAFPQIEPTSIRLDYDHAEGPSAYRDLSEFILERRAGHRFDDSVFWSQSPLRTEDHIKLLEALELLLST